MDMERKVLVLDDDVAISATIGEALMRDGWVVRTAHTLFDGRLQLQRDNPRIVIVDLNLPDGNGIAFVREAAQREDTGIIVVSGRCDEVDRIVGLEVGADDYLTKPFSMREMAARVGALSRRLDGTSRQLGVAMSEPVEAPVVAEAWSAADAPAAAPRTSMSSIPDPASWSMSGVRLEPSRLRLTAADGKEARLTGGEAGLLGLLLAAPDHLADRETISDRVLGRRLLPEQRGVDQLASSLRQKLLGISQARLTVAAVRGKGYRLMW